MMLFQVSIPKIQRKPTQRARISAAYICLKLAVVILMTSLVASNPSPKDSSMNLHLENIDELSQESFNIDVFLHELSSASVPDSDSSSKWRERPTKMKIHSDNRKAEHFHNRKVYSVEFNGDSDEGRGRHSDDNRPRKLGNVGRDYDGDSFNPESDVKEDKDDFNRAMNDYSENGDDFEEAGSDYSDSDDYEVGQDYRDDSETDENEMMNRKAKKAIDYVDVPIKNVKIPDLFAESKKCSKKCGLKTIKGSGQSKDDKSMKRYNQPWMAKIYVRKGPSIGYCTGGVINKKFIISAAHCFCPNGWCTSEHKDFKEGGDDEVRLESVGSIEDNKDEDEGMVFVENSSEYEYANGDGEGHADLVDRIYIHPNRIKLEKAQEKFSGFYDFALLRMAKELELGDLIQPICLPLDTKTQPASESSSFVDTSVKAVIAGYGQMLPSRDSRCLTSNHGPAKFHICEKADIYSKCNMTYPPKPFGDICKGADCSKHNASGPLGWCKVEQFEGEHYESKPAWGFCSIVCQKTEITPPIYHAQAGVGVLTSKRCSKLLENQFKPPSAKFNGELELCAGRQIKSKKKAKKGKRKKRETSSENEEEKDSQILKKVLQGGKVVYMQLVNGEPVLMEKKTETGRRLTRITMGGDVGGVDACQGDSGGPLWVDWDKKAVLIGVISRGKVCASLNRPGIYSRVLPVLRWIYDTTKKYDCYSM